MSSSKKLTFKETFGQCFSEFIDRTVEIKSVILLFSTQFYEMLPLSPSLWFNSPSSHLPCVNKYTVYTFTL
jgi:hypothetical protein